MTKRIKKIADNIVQAKKKHVKKEDPLRSSNLVSTGSTLLNLALSGHNPYGGYALGTVVHVIGDTNIGKSVLGLSLMAEVCKDKRFEKYGKIYDEPETAMFFPLEKMFGNEIKKVKFIPTDEERKKTPRTVQDWYVDLIDTYRHPFIYVEDSLDALTSEEELEDDHPRKGGYKTEKAKVSSKLFAEIVGKIGANKSLLFIISQTRKNLGKMFGPSDTFTGGQAIKFYRSYEIWLRKRAKIVQKVRGEDREIGNYIIAKVTKNKFVGKKRVVEFPIYDDYGIDDLESCIDWLVKYKFWTKEKGKAKITVHDRSFVSGSKDKIIDFVEANNYEDELRNYVAECWLEMEDETSEGFSHRKAKY